jgi:hypothetical protein
MATSEIEVGRRASLLTRLLTPRPVSLLLLGGGGLAAGELAWRFLPYQLTVYLSSLAGPMCMVVAVAAWSMRDKVDATFDAKYLDPRAYSQSRFVVRDVRARSLALAFACMLCASLAVGPAFSSQLLKAIYQWMVIGSGLGVGLVAYCFQIAFAWEEQLRTHREKIVVDAKELEVLKDLESRITLGGIPARGYWGSGWTSAEEDLSRPH